MTIERYYLSCLAHASYMVGSGGVAAVIDPQRDVHLYIEAAAKLGWRIGYVIESHLHADFVSGHRELAERTGAKIYMGAEADVLFDYVAVGAVYWGYAVCRGCGAARFVSESHAAAARRDSL